MLFVLCVGILAACNTIGLSGATPTPTADRAATDEAQAMQDVLSTERIQATVDAVYIAAEAEVTDAALTKAATTPTLHPLHVRGTAEAEQTFGIVQSLYDAEFISTTAGVNLRVNRTVESRARLNGFGWSFPGHSPSDFVFRADIGWDSASDVANWFDSGCGIVFREYDRGNNFYGVFIFLDGNISLFAYVNDRWQEITTRYYGRLDVPEGEGELIVTAEGDHIQVFVNSKLVIDVNDARHTEGDFGFIVASGTNKSFGTRCTFDNMTLWELDIAE